MSEGRGRDQRTLVLYGQLGRWCLERSYARAFEELGYHVRTFDAQPGGADLAWWARSRPGARLSRGSLCLRRLASRGRNAAFRDRVLACRPDLVFVVKGTYLMPESVSSLRRAGIPVAVFQPDAPVLGNSAYRPEHLSVVREADVTFIWSRALQRTLEMAGARTVAYLPFAWDPKVFPRVDCGTVEGADVVFVGGWDPNRERWLEPVAKHFQLKIWGPDYWGNRTRRGSRLRRSWQGHALRGPEAARTVAGAKIVLNIIRDQNLPDGTNMRTFEVPGAGGFLLATRTAGATEIYPEGEAGAYFSSVEELLEKLEHYLARPEERGAIAGRAHQITAREHRYVHRARRILGSVPGLS